MTELTHHYNYRFLCLIAELWTYERNCLPARQLWLTWLMSAIPVIFHW